MTFTGADFRRVVWSALFSFLITFALGLAGVLEGLATSCQEAACDWGTAGAALSALAVSALVATLSFVKNLVLSDSSGIK